MAGKLEITCWEVWVRDWGSGADSKAVISRGLFEGIGTAC